MKSLKSISLYVLAAGLIFALAFVKQSKGLEAKAFSQKIKATPDAQVIDVRTPEEYSTGFIAGAVNIDWNNDNFDKRIAKVEKTRPTFVYCRSGRRSADAAEAMRDMGFKQVYELSGGMQSWESAGLPTKHAVK